MDGSTTKPRLREQVRAVMRLHHYSIRTEKSYWYWIRYFIRFHRLRHPLEGTSKNVDEAVSTRPRRSHKNKRKSDWGRIRLYEL